jgi:hypothetical protein
MKQSCFRKHRTQSGIIGKIGRTALATLLLAIFFLLCLDGAILSRGSAFNDCATTAECSGCAIGQPCCKLDNACLPLDATACPGTACNPDGQCTDANVCKRIQGAPITPGDCTAGDANCMACPIGNWCCKADGACFDPKQILGCAGVCSTACTSDQVCSVVPLTPTLNPAACTAGDTKCANCGMGSWCCKADGACFDPFVSQTCGGGCMGANCTAGGVCEQRRILPRTCTAQDGSSERQCTSCKAGQLCCSKDGTCLDPTNKTCEGSACSASNCNTGAYNLCIISEPFSPDPPPCTTTNGQKACMECPAGKYCCLQDGACFDPSTACPNTSCGGVNCNSTQVCKKIPVVCPTWTHALTFMNNSSETIWLAAIPGCWKEGGTQKCHPTPDPGGWAIPSKGTATVQVPPCWSGGFVFRTDCNFNEPDGKHCKQSPCCKTGDCLDKDSRSAFACVSGGEAPASRIEMTFDGGLDGTGNKIQSLTDTYDISFVNGWTKMVTMEPAGTNWSPIGPDPSKAAYWCTQSGCDKSPVCPQPLAFTDTTDTVTHTYCWAPVGFSGTVHATDSSFPVTYKGKTTTYTNDNAFKSKLGCVCDNTKDISCALPPDSTNINPACNDPTGALDFYGCSPYSEPGMSHLYSQCCPWTSTQGETCGWDLSNPNQAKRVWPDWAQDYILNIKAVCQKAYTWQYDDTSSTYNCVSTDLNSAVNYNVIIYDGGGQTTAVPAKPAGR